MGLCKKSKIKKALKKADKLLAKAAKTQGKKAEKLLARAEQKSAYAQKLSQKKGKGLLVFGLLLAGLAAGAAAFKASRPVEDPWKTPAA